MIIENQRYFGRDIANAVNTSRDIGTILARNKKPVVIQKMVTEDIKENIAMQIEETPQNPQEVIPYESDILTYLRQEENKYLVDNYMTKERQPDINAKMRAILVDWLIDVHAKFLLKEETLFMAVQLMDRYLNLVPTTRMHLQLVGVAALFIASKYEDIYPPPLKDFAYVTDNAYIKQDILDMESKMLQTLNFNITQPSAYTFLQKYKHSIDEKNFNLMHYVLQLSLVDYSFCSYKPSAMAACAYYLVKKIRKSYQDEETDSELRPLAYEMCSLLRGAELNSLQAVRKKFTGSKYLEVAKIRVEKKQ